MTKFQFGIVAVIALALLGGPVRDANAQFATGNIIVLRSGDGTASLSNAGTAVFLDQYNPTAVGQTMPSVSFALPTTGGTRLVQSGTATSEGLITFNAATSTIAVAGYDAATGTAGVATSASATVNRVVNAVDLSGNSGAGSATRVATSTNFTGGNIRSATWNGTTAWSAGSNTGVVTSPGDTVVSSTSTNIRLINSFNGNLYYSTASGTTRGIFQVGTGLPTSSGTTSTNIISMGAAAQATGFAISPSGTTAYISDDRVSTSPGAGVNTGGVQKWTFDGTAWSLAGTFDLTASLGATIGQRSVAVDFSGSNPILYTTTADAVLPRLITFTDTGSFTQTATILATSPTNEAFRSVIFYSPVPEPATVLAFAAGVLGVGGYVRRRVCG